MKPKNARLYHFVADPPTTTLQRLKGLTTGSLPTFVDAGSNFASSEITEDNFIDQLIGIGKMIIFAGDDTWTGLYPNRFYESHPYPSFNVKDLHTVDKGVIQHLIPKLRKKYWDIMIGHFLGVDHCGHTYGPNHPIMTEKLQQMDNVISSVVKEMKADTILFVLGDHGMTRTGDHGGDSPDELDAALFVYSPTQITASPPQRGRHQEVSQIDFVPTVSLLLGAPVPFSNLGTVITDLFNYCPWWETDGDYTKQVYHAVKALRLNANQIHSYLKAYNLISNELPEHMHAELDELFIRSEKELSYLVTALHMEGNSKEFLPRLENIQSQYLEYLSRAKSMCQDIWAKFDLGLMFMGSCTTFVALLLNLWIWIHMDIKQDSLIKASIAVTWSVCVAIFLGFLLLLSFSFVNLVICCLSGMVVFIVIGLVFSHVFSTDMNRVKKETTHKKKLQPLQENSSLLSYASPLCVIAYVGSLFSNSFVVYEDLVTSFFTHSLVWVAAYEVLHVICAAAVKQNGKGKKLLVRFDVGRLITSPVNIVLCLSVASCVSVRFAANFFQCREEQWTCEPSLFLQSLSKITDDMRAYKNYKYFFTISSVLLLPYGLYKILKYYGNLNGYSPAVLCASYATPMSMVCACLYWALQALPQEVLETIPAWQLVLLPRVVYVLSIFSIAILLLFPLCIYVVHQSKKSDLHMSLLGTQPDDIVPRVYNHVKMNWRKHLLPQYTAREEPEPKPPIVYGLATVYSSSLLIIIFSLFPVLVLLLGDGAAPSVTLQVFVLFLFLELHAAWQNRKYPEAKLDVSWGAICAWNFIGCHFFFASGHHTTVPGIRWESAFVGFSDDHDVYAIPAMMITLNTFSSYIISMVTLPLLVFWPYFRGNLPFLFDKETEGTSEQVQQKGEFFLKENEDGLCMVMLRLMLGCLLFYGCRVCATMLSVGLLRRHLMVWKIFAPRFVFEGATFLLISVLLVLIYGIVLRINHALTKWTETLEC